MPFSRLLSAWPTRQGELAAGKRARGRAELLASAACSAARPARASASGAPHGDLALTATHEGCYWKATDCIALTGIVGGSQLDFHRPAVRSRLRPPSRASPSESTSSGADNGWCLIRTTRVDARPRFESTSTHCPHRWKSTPSGSPLSTARSCQLSLTSPSCAQPTRKSTSQKINFPAFQPYHLRRRSTTF